MLITRKTILIISLLLIVINISAIFLTEDLYYSRYTRLIASSSLFLVFLLLKGFKKMLLLIAFLFLISADICMLNFEFILWNKLNFTFSIFGHILISIYLISQIKNLKFNLSLIGFFVLISLLNVLFINQLVSIPIQDSVNSMSTYTYAFGFSLILLGVSVSAYNLKYFSERSSYALLFVFGLILANVFNYLAYYLEIRSLFYVNRVLYIMSLTIFVVFSVTSLREVSPLILEREKIK